MFVYVCVRGLRLCKDGNVLISGWFQLRMFVCVCVCVCVRGLRLCKDGNVLISGWFQLWMFVCVCVWMCAWSAPV